MKGSFFFSCKASRALESLCKHLMNEEYSFKHRMTIGAIIGLIGVFIASVEPHIVCGKIITEGIGFAFHGIGVLPIVEKLSKYKDKT